MIWIVKEWKGWLLWVVVLGVDLGLGVHSFQCKHQNWAILLILVSVAFLIVNLRWFIKGGDRE